MSKLLKRSNEGRNNSYHISQIKTSIDSLIATHTAIATAHHTPPTIPKIYVQAVIWEFNAAWENEGLTLDSNTDQMRFACIIPSDADTSQDVIVRIRYFCQQADATVLGHRYQGAIAIEEAFGYVNIANGVVHNIDSTIANASYETIFTYSAGDISDGDILSGIWKLSEASRTVFIQNVMFEFEV